MLSMIQRRILTDMKKSKFYISLVLLLHRLSMVPILYYSICRADRARCCHSNQALARTFDAVQRKVWQWIQRIDQRCPRDKQLNPKGKHKTAVVVKMNSIFEGDKMWE